HDSDFGVFVFGADDVTNMRGEFLKVPRDNVVYECGLFSGVLGSTRCFMVVPQEIRVHLPTDLLGITVGEYEAHRRDADLRAAVAPFCDEVRRKLRELGY